MLYSLNVIKERAFGRLDNMDHVLNAIAPSGQIDIVDFCRIYYAATNDIETVAAIAAAVKVHLDEVKRWPLIPISNDMLNGKQVPLSTVVLALMREASTLAWQTYRVANMPGHNIADVVALHAQAARLMKAIFDDPMIVFLTIMADLERITHSEEQ